MFIGLGFTEKNSNCRLLIIYCLFLIHRAIAEMVGIDKFDAETTQAILKKKSVTEQITRTAKTYGGAKKKKLQHFI